MKAWAIMVGILVCIAAIVSVAINVLAYSGIWLSSRRLRSQLRLRNRSMNREEVRQRIARNEGMLLADAPTLGWNVVRIWWSPHTDFVSDGGSPGPDELASKADSENHDRFIDTSTGSASLVDGFVITQRLKSYLKRHFGVDDCAFVFTGAVLFERDLKRRNLKNAS